MFGPNDKDEDGFVVDDDGSRHVEGSQERDTPYDDDNGLFNDTK